MIIMLAPALVAAIPAIIGAAQSIAGGIGKASKKRPKYEIPDEVEQATALAAARAQSPYMPGFEAARSSIDVSAANALQSASASGLGSAAVLPGIMGSVNQANTALAAESANYQAGAEQQYMAALMNMAEFDDREFQLNELAPYMDASRLFEDMIGAGIKNIGQGAGNYLAGMEAGLIDTPAHKLPRSGMAPLQTLGTPGISPVTSSNPDPYYMGLPGITPGNMHFDFLKSQYIQSPFS